VPVNTIDQWAALKRATEEDELCRTRWETPEVAEALEGSPERHSRSAWNAFEKRAGGVQTEMDVQQSWGDAVSAMLFNTPEVGSAAQLRGFFGADVESEELEELRQLLSQDTSVRPRSELVIEGDRPVLVTAPHCICLLRDGHRPHLVEEYTSAIAKAIAKQLGGTSLRWTSSEQRCSELLRSIGKRCDDTTGMLIDPRNRDPNYLSAAELATNPWYQQMLSTAMCWRELFGQAKPTLHVDVHGCRDPPGTPSHLTVGLGAMKLQAERCGGPKALACVEAFSAALELGLYPVLAGLRLKPRAQLVRVLVPLQRDEANMSFSGAWSPEARRHTQSQQAVTFAGFTHAVQLEMSRVLRRMLLQNKVSMLRFCCALRAAWVTAQRT